MTLFVVHTPISYNANWRQLSQSPRHRCRPRMQLFLKGSQLYDTQGYVLRILASTLRPLIFQLPACMSTTLLLSPTPGVVLLQRSLLLLALVCRPAKSAPRSAVFFFVAASMSALLLYPAPVLTRWS